MKRFWLILLVAAVPALGQTSRLGSYAVTLTAHGGARQAGEQNSVDIVLNDRAGNELFRLSRVIPYDVPFPSAAVFETGSVMLVHAFDGLVEFFDRSGTLRQTIRPVKESGPEYERIIAVAVHDSIAAVLVSEPARETAAFFVLTDRAEILATREVDGTTVSGIVLSNNALTAAAGVYGWNESRLREQTHFLSSTGELEGSVDAGFIAGAFSPDDTEFLGLTKRQATVIVVPGTAIRFALAAGEGTMFVDGTWNGTEAVLLSANLPVLQDGRWIYSHPVLRQVSRDGAVKLLQEVPSAEFSSASLERLGDQVVLRMERP